MEKTIAMGQDSKIEWCHHTGNLWWGCVEVHEGCDNCYAAALAHRYNHDVWGNDKSRREIMSVWKDLQKYQRLAAQAGEMHRVFVGSMMDIFEKPMPLVNRIGTTDHLRQKLFAQISAGLYPNLLFLFLTKRPGNINKYTPESWKENPPANVMFGTSPVNQPTADKLIAQLCAVRGKRFLSVEPMLGEVDLLKNISGIDWVIVGGESGPRRREFNPDWARKIKKQCEEHGVPFFMKQWDKVKAIPADLMLREFPKAA